MVTINKYFMEKLCASDAVVLAADAMAVLVNSQGSIKRQVIYNRCDVSSEEKFWFSTFGKHLFGYILIWP